MSPLSADSFGHGTHALATRWHWRAFLTGGGSAFWLLAYGLFYWLSRLSLDSFSSVALYLGYLFLLVILDFLVTGQSFGSFIGSLLLNSHHGLQVPLDFWLRTGLYGSYIAQLGSTEKKNTRVILAVSLILCHRLCIVYFVV